MALNSFNKLTEQMLSEQRPVLFRYALLQLRDSELADDIVQDTLLAAWQSIANYEGKAGLRTWLISILKHKIADHHRRSAREAIMPIPENLAEEEDDEDNMEKIFFLSNGHWNGGPNTWSDPEAALNCQEFWVIYELCQNNLPQKMAKVFMLRELVGLEADEICRDTGLSDANYWVTLHRARLRLRECLENRWFNQSNKENYHA